MADADIIPLGTRGRPGRGTGRNKPSASSRELVAGSRNDATNGPAVPPQAPDDRSAERPEPGEPQGDAAAHPPAAPPPAPPPAQPGRELDPSGAAPAGRPGVDRLGVDRSGVDRSGVDRPGADQPEAGESAGPVWLREVTQEPGAGRLGAGASGAAGEDAAREPTAASQRRLPGGLLGGLPGSLPVGDLLSALRGAAKEVFGDDWERRTAELLAFWRRRITGDYEVDEYGLDSEVADRFLLAAIRPLAETWFRVEVRGLDNLPADGGALVVSNHSGTIPLDGLVTTYVVRKHTGRHLRPLGADLVFRTPYLGELARKGGATLACTEDAERMLSRGELVGVWPEGFKGIGKPYSERYKLQRFGRGGFVSAAMTTGAPIVPCSVVGAEEIYPLIGNVPVLARLIGLPYVPITPLFPWLGPLGMVPLPSKWVIEFGEPIRTDSYDPLAADDPMLVFDITDQVREAIQQNLYTLLMQRRSVFH